MINDDRYFNAENRTQRKTVEFLSALSPFALCFDRFSHIFINVVKSCSGDTYSSNENFNNCVDQSASSVFNCASFFQKSAFSCSSIDQTNRFPSFANTYQQIQLYVLTLKPGYNIFTNLQNLIMKPGYILVVEPTATGTLIDLDQTVPGLSDYQISPFTPLNGKLRINTIISPFNKIWSVSHQYTIQNNYSVSVTLTNRLNSTDTASVSKYVMVYESVRDLMVTSLTGGLICFKDKDCTLIPSVSTGKDLTYNWTIDSNVYSTTQPQFVHQFATVGTVPISLLAYNHFSNESIIVVITVTDRLEGLYFKAGTGAQSASAVGKNADFLFILQSGANYICHVDYGGQTHTFGDDVYNLNNSFISHVYSQEKVYQVSITCANQINSLSLNFDHHVQQELTGLKLSNNVTLVNQPFYIEFSLETGSAISESLLLFNNQQETITFDALTGKGILHGGLSLANRHPVYIELKNFVSTIELDAFFEISSPIINPSFEITPSGDLATRKYSFPHENFIEIRMDSGSNVRIEINTDFFGELLPNGLNLLDIQTNGEWSDYANSASNTHKISYNFIHPGDYLVKVTLSNHLGSFTLTEQISIISKVDGLVPALADLNPDNYVLFEVTDGTAGKGVAEFVFQYEAESKAGSHASIVFWPGDLTNLTNGPFFFKMDFNRNISVTPIKYVYNATGTYEAKFLIYNDRGSKSFSLMVNVVIGIFGFYIDVLPKSVGPSDKFTVSAYMIQGDNVNYTLKVDDVVIKEYPKTSLSYEQSDSQILTAGPVGVYKIDVIATDKYLPVTRSYTLNVVQKIASFSLTASPQLRINDDSNPLSRTFTFTIGINDPNAMFLIDYGDNSTIDFPRPVNSQTQLTHQYSQSGLYRVIVTVSNSVSSITNSITVQIAADFAGLNCQLFWRPFDSDGTIEYQYTFSGDQYIVKKDFDLRFKCTWLRLAV
ncbi:polycystin-1-like isoform X2 [Brachionus plicatilis]|uniref:Polycystin-1-like isoform X2 n=1 Tax=Brachionus plicatilis TaxID=10195 RepID=A0A3M7PFL5_BRAPC|nr:polycystin-1-like isoform X2 [Brachionus plicatilis]